MTAFTLGQVAAIALGRMGRQETGQPLSSRRAPVPVRRDSVEAGTFEDRFFATPAAGECDRMVRTVRDALDVGRRLRRTARAEGRELAGPERAFAALTAGAVRVFEELCTLARLNRGRVYPSYDRLVAATALGRATVARALSLLERAGFLVRQRRFVRLSGEGAGPRYAQTSNAYRPALPVTLDRLLPRWKRPAPVPDDAVQHATEQVQTTKAMRARIGCRDLALATVDGALGRVLARLGAALDRREDCAARESHIGPETLPHLIDSGIHSAATRAQSPWRSAVALAMDAEVMPMVADIDAATRYSGFDTLHRRPVDM